MNTRIILTLLDLVKSIDSFASYNLASWKAANPTAIMLGDREEREGGGWERGGRWEMMYLQWSMLVLFVLVTIS